MAHEAGNPVGFLTRTLAGAGRRDADATETREPAAADQRRAGTPDATMGRSMASTAAGATTKLLPRVATPGPRDRITRDDVEQMQVKFRTAEHQRRSASTLLGNTPVPRPLSRGVPAAHMVRRGPGKARRSHANSSVNPTVKECGGVVPQPTAAADEPAGESEGCNAPSETDSETHSSTRSSSAVRPLTLQPRDVAILCRLGAVQSDHPAAKSQMQLRHGLPMKRIDLRWLYEVERRPNAGDARSRRRWVDIDAFTSDDNAASLGASIHRRNHKHAHKYDGPTSAGSSPMHRPSSRSPDGDDEARSDAGSVTPCFAARINSPRSVLALFQCGVDVEQLVPIDEEALRKRLAIQGVDPASVDSRVAFCHQERAKVVAQALHQHARVCEAIERDTILAFTDVFVDSGADYSRLPILTKEEQTGRSGAATCKYEVAMPTDDRVSDALEKIRGKTHAEQRMIRDRIESELQGRKRLAAMREAKAAEALRVTVRREQAEEEQRQQRKDEAALRALIAAERSETRTEARMAAERKLEEERRAREAATAAVERAAEATKAARAAERQKRLDEKARKRDGRLADAAAAAAKIEAQRLERVAASEAHREVLEREKEAAQKARRKEHAKRQAAQEKRRAEVVERSQTLLEARRTAAEARQEEADRKLAEFEEAKTIEREVKQLRDVKKALLRDDQAADFERRVEAERQARSLATEAQSRRFHDFRRDMEVQREVLAERAREAKESKRAVVEQNGRKLEFRRLMIEDDLEAKVGAAELLQRSRVEVTLEATAARTRMGVDRRDRLQAAAADGVVAERKSFFELYSASSNGAGQKRRPLESKVKQGSTSAKGGATRGGAEDSVPTVSPAPLPQPDSSGM